MLVQKCYLNEIMLYVSFGDWPFSLSIVSLRLSKLLQVAMICYFLSMRSIPFIRHTTVYFSSHLLKIWVVSSLGQLLCENKSSFL